MPSHIYIHKTHHDITKIRKIILPVVDGVLVAFVVDVEVDVAVVGVVFEDDVDVGVVVGVVFEVDVVVGFVVVGASEIIIKI